MRCLRLSRPNGIILLSVLGVCYAKGEGVDKNRRTTVELYEQAAEQGHTAAIEAFLHLLSSLLIYSLSIPAVHYDIMFPFL